MGAKTHYLCRTEDGKCRTVVAQSHRGAMKKFLEKYDGERGEVVDVKERGAGDDWQSFKIR